MAEQLRKKSSEIPRVSQEFLSGNQKLIKIISKSKNKKVGPYRVRRMTQKESLNEPFKERQMSLSKFERREKVSLMLSQGYTEVQIGQKLGVKRRTIVQDEAFLKEEAQKWINDLARDGFVFETKMTLDMLKDTKKQLTEMLDQDDLSIDERRKLLKQRDYNIHMQLTLLEQGPVVASIRKYLPTELKVFENYS